MPNAERTVAILTASPALSALVAMMVGAMPGLAVRQFADPRALGAALREERIDLLVADFDHPRAPADRLASAIRRDRRITHAGLQIVALARHVGPDARRISTDAGIDEVILKPMSPLFLLERIRARLLPEPHYPGTNIIPLFGPPIPL